MVELGPAGQRFLRICARVSADQAGIAVIRAAAASVENWSELAWAADAHGLAPLVRRHVRQLGLAVPDKAQQQLTALAIRHRDVSLAHAATTVEILDALDAAGVDVIVLKGAVLAFDVYPAPELRPRKDLDLLVRPQQATGAVDALRRLGFQTSDEPRPRGHHHHLPALVRARDGHTVSVEIHTDAISHDQPDSLTFDTMTGPVRRVPVGPRTAPAFGHVDMLRHLSAHLLEPAEETRLISVVDLVEYAAKYANDTDWDAVRQRWPRVANTLSLLHYVTPLPERLAPFRPPDNASVPQGAGEGFPPLHDVPLRGRGVGASLRRLLYPSEWWMRAYYAVPPGRGLGSVRWTRHAPRLVYWVLRRAR